MTDEARVADREIDCFVAVNVMDMAKSTFEVGLPGTGGETYWCPKDDVRLGTCERLPKFTSDPAADYLVLQKVRETWPVPEQKRFCDCLQDIYAERRCAKFSTTEFVGCLEAGIPPKEWAYLEMEHEKGDYARAAKAAIEAQKGA